MAMSRLILCADDFGLSRPISETIADLLHAGRINATTCMTLCPGWEADAALLRDLPAGAQIGLHLTLTGETPLTAAPRLAPEGRLPDADPLLRAALLGTVPLDEVAAEIDAQFVRFAEVMGRAPDFVDGHQHSHVLPGIRTLVLDATRRHAPAAWLRNCVDRPGAIAARPFRGKAIGSALHATGFGRAAARRGLRCNDSFAGHYDFRSEFNDLLPQFLRRPGAMHLVMCHPGAGALAGDGIAEARIGEAAALRAVRIADMASEHGLEFHA